MHSSRYFAPSFVLLQQEGHLIHSSLTAGLTQIRNGQIDQKGKLYNAFFNLTIGIERLLKILIIMEHYISADGKFPNQQEIKSHGHDIRGLFDKIRKIAEKHDDKINLSPILFPAHASMIEFLSDFAKGTRYSNFNNIANGTRAQDPLDKWKEILEEIQKLYIPEKVSKKISASGKQFGKLMAQAGSLTMQGLNGEDLTHEDAYSKAALIHATSPFIVLTFFKILRPVLELSHALTNKAHELYHSKKLTKEEVPYMYEFIEFLGSDEEVILAQETWE